MKWRAASGLMGRMFLNYGLIAISVRMLARGSYIGVGITDALIAWFGFTMLQNVTKADSRLEKVGYALGGCAGSLLGLWVTSGHLSEIRDMLRTLVS